MSLGSTVSRGAKSIPAERGSMKDLRHINILDHIAVGHENARTGVELAKILDINPQKLIIAINGTTEIFAIIE